MRTLLKRTWRNSQATFFSHHPAGAHQELMQQKEAAKSQSPQLIGPGKENQRGSSGIQFETFEHESKHSLPVFELEIAQQGVQILEKALARA